MASRAHMPRASNIRIIGQYVRAFYYLKRAVSQIILSRTILSNTRLRRWNILRRAWGEDLFSRRSWIFNEVQIFAALISFYPRFTLNLSSVFALLDSNSGESRNSHGKMWCRNCCSDNTLICNQQHSGWFAHPFLALVADIEKRISAFDSTCGNRRKKLSTKVWMGKGTRVFFLPVYYMMWN